MRRLEAVTLFHRIRVGEGFTPRGEECEKGGMWRNIEGEGG